MPSHPFTVLVLDASCAGCDVDAAPAIARSRDAVERYRPRVAMVFGLPTPADVDAAFGLGYDVIYYGVSGFQGEDPSRPLTSTVVLAHGLPAHRSPFKWLSPTPSEADSAFEGEAPSAFAEGISRVDPFRNITFVGARIGGHEPSRSLELVRRFAGPPERISTTPTRKDAPPRA